MGQHIGYIVVLEEPINDEYSTEHVINALKQIKGVVDVKPVSHSFESALVESRVRHELRMRLYDLIQAFGDKKP